MENPHEQVQNALLSRIINNMVRTRSSVIRHILTQENLNESIVAMNNSLQEINRSNMDTEMVSQMWENYSKNSQFNLEATGQKQDPIWATNIQLLYINIDGKEIVGARMDNGRQRWRISDMVTRYDRI